MQCVPREIKAESTRPNSCRSLPPVRQSIAGVLLGLTAAAAGLGIFLRVALLDGGSLWLDELWTLDAVSRSFKEMVGARLVSDQSPPLWTVITWGWLHASGTYDASIMRLLATGFGLLAVAAPLVGAAKFRSVRPTLLVMGTLMALSLFPIQFAVELRPYALMIGLGAVATVIWVGLLTAELPRSGTWIFMFAFTGALAGFGHYYGNLLYVGESAFLFVVLMRAGARRPLVTHIAWGIASIVPVIAWYILTRPWFRGEAVADPPSLIDIQAWAAFAFAPMTNVLAGHSPGYPEGYGLGLPGMYGTAVLILTFAAIGGIYIADWLRWRDTDKVRPAATVGVAAATVLLIGLGAAWIGSIVLPPSMNIRNLAALIPALFLAVACAATPFRSNTLRVLSGSLVVGGWLLATVLIVTQYGTGSLVPQWQQQAGYREASRALLSARSESPAPTLLGLEAPWGWHGQWDAVLRAQLRAEPATPTDAPPLTVVWLGDIADIADGVGDGDGSLIVFADNPDDRAAGVFAWAEATRDRCETQSFGGPGIGLVEVLRCP